MVTPGAKRDAVAHARNCYGLSERRACHLMGIARRVARYQPRVTDDTGLRQRLRDLAAARRRFGYRRLGYLLAREGLKLRRRGGRKRALGTRAPMALPQGPNQRWSLDFVSDAFRCGRRFRILCVVDDFTRECLALVPDKSLSGARVARELVTIAAIRGKKLAVVSALRCIAAIFQVAGLAERHQGLQHGFHLFRAAWGALEAAGDIAGRGWGAAQGSAQCDILRGGFLGPGAAAAGFRTLHGHFNLHGGAACILGRLKFRAEPADMPARFFRHTFRIQRD